MSLALEGVGKSFGPTRALDAVDLAVAGGRTAIVGPSGSGKTTLLRVVAGFERPDEGRVALDGAVLADVQTFVPAHRRGIGYVAQDGALFPHLSVADNVAFGLERRAPDREGRVRALLDLVELGPGFADRRPHQLSGGQQQRVALARALARSPRVMLLDEPFSALDPGLRESLRGTVSRVLAAASIATILVTHDREEALSYADQLAVLDGGRLVRTGAPRDVYLRPGDRATALLLGEALLLPADLAGGAGECALGRLPVDSGHGGRAEIMLRHEQLRLAAASSGEAAARVETIEFRGATCLVGLRLGSGAPLRLTVAAPEAPREGEGVSVAVLGTAHVLRDAPV